MAVRLPGGMLSLLYGYGKLIVLALCRGRNRHEYLCPGLSPTVLLWRNPLQVGASCGATQSAYMSKPEQTRGTPVKRCCSQLLLDPLRAGKKVN